MGDTAPKAEAEAVFALARSAGLRLPPRLASLPASLQPVLQLAAQLAVQLAVQPTVPLALTENNHRDVYRSWLCG